MPRSADSAHLDLHRVFARLQAELSSQLAVAALFEHASSAGHAAERLWINLLRRHLPRRYRAAPAFIIDHTGARSRQIDLAIFDNLYTPVLFPHASGLHIPAESVYAVFEIKSQFTRQWMREAQEKAASVLSLKRTSIPTPARPNTTPQPILTGLLAADSIWNPEKFAANLKAALTDHPLDIGCALAHGSFTHKRTRTTVSTPNHSLMFFILHLLDRLRALGTAAPADFSAYLPKGTPAK